MKECVSNSCLLGKNCLPVQPTSAPSERIFSAASMLISSWRTNMGPDFAGDTFFVQSNWNWFEETVDLAQIDLEAADENEGAKEFEVSACGCGCM